MLADLATSGVGRLHPLYLTLEWHRNSKLSDPAERLLAQRLDGSFNNTTTYSISSPNTTAAFQQHGGAADSHDDEDEDTSDEEDNDSRSEDEETSSEEDEKSVRVTDYLVPGAFLDTVRPL